MSKYPTKKQTINDLIRTIREEIEAGKAAAETALEGEKTMTYWKVGRHIHKYMAANKVKAVQGDDVIEQIAQALEIGYRTLRYALSFYERFPEIPAPRPRLTWTHFRILLSVKDENARQELEDKVLKEGLNTRELLELAKAANQLLLGYDYIKKLSVSRGYPNIYQIKTILRGKEERKCIDLGFRVYLDVSVFDLPDYPEGTIINVKFGVKKPIFTEMPEGKSGILFTYESYVKEIIDGDTIWIELDLGFNTWIMQKIRLREINAGGLDTETGQNVKAFIGNRLKDCEKVIVKTHYRDKYDRYLGDLFYIPEASDMTQVAETGTFINQELLDNHLAVDYEDKKKDGKKR